MCMCMCVCVCVCVRACVRVCVFTCVVINKSVTANFMPAILEYIFLGFRGYQ